MSVVNQISLSCIGSAIDLGESGCIEGASRYLIPDPPPPPACTAIDVFAGLDGGGGG